MQKSKSEPNCQTNALVTLGYPKRKSTGNLRQSISQTSSMMTQTSQNKVNRNYKYGFCLLKSYLDLASTWTL